MMAAPQRLDRADAQLRACRRHPSRSDDARIPAPAAVTRRNSPPFSPFWTVVCTLIDTSGVGALQPVSANCLEWTPSPLFSVSDTLHSSLARCALHVHAHAECKFSALPHPPRLPLVATALPPASPYSAHMSMLCRLPKQAQVRVRGTNRILYFPFATILLPSILFDTALSPSALCR
eukprot:IDg3427t1